MERETMADRTNGEMETVAMFLDGVARDGDWENEDGTPINPITIREAARRLREMDGERIEGVAWLDGDSFCPGDDGNGGCQKSHMFVPHCEHESREDYRLDGNERFATLILKAPQESNDG